MVAASTIVLVIVGVALFFLFKIIGGEREIANATDSGSLNVAKQVMVDPSIAFNPGNADVRHALGGCVNAQGKVDLLTYNRFVAQGLLVAMNASADGRQLGITHANNLMSAIQVGPDSIGGQLAAALQDGESNQRWASRHFGGTALSNSLRMLGNGSRANYTAGDFATAFVVNTGETNISNGTATQAFITGNIPFRDYNAGTRLTVPTLVGSMHTEAGQPQEQYLIGYQGIQLNLIARPIFGVAVQPRQQPHLIRAADFNAARTGPGSDVGINLPPNCFRTGGSATEQGRSGQDTHSVAMALIGLPSTDINLAPNTSGAQAFVPSIPDGYLYVDNRNVNPGTPVDLPSTDNWFAHEAGPGTRAVRTTPPTFGSDVDAWVNRAEDANINDLPRDNLYKSDGSKITSAADAAALIPRGASTVTCTDINYMNTQPCNSLANPGQDGRSAFDIAFGRSGTGSVGTDPAGSLIATEQAKCWVRTLYNVGDTVSFDNTFGPTGLRIYSAYPGSPFIDGDPYDTPAVPARPRGTLPHVAGLVRWGPDGCGTCWNQTQPLGGNADHQCQVTENGTIYELFQQTTSAFPYYRIEGANTQTVNGGGGTQAETEVQRMIRQRMREIKPNCTAADFAVIENLQIELGADYFICLENPRSPLTSNFVVRRTAPTYAAGFSDRATASTPDGTRCTFRNVYSISPSMVDTANDFRIHDHMFMNNSVNATSTDECSYQPASGAFGLLGVIDFSQSASGSGQMSSRD